MRPEVEVQSCLSRMREFCDEIQAILDLLEDKGQLFKEERSQAREMLKRLKARLKAERKRGDTAKGRSKLTQTELDSYIPAVNDADAEIHVSVSSIPDHRWYDELWDARSQFRFYIGNLEDSIDKE